MMRFERVLTEFRESLVKLANEIDISVRSNQLNITHLAEFLFCDLLNALYGWRLRNLNTDDPNFPAIDLADDGSRVAVQVTATPELDKVKNTIIKFLDHDLDSRYDRLIVFVATRRQSTYRQKSIDAVVDSRMKFDVRRDILDYRDLAKQATTTRPARVHLALSKLNSYVRDTVHELADEDVNPPAEASETLTTNLVPIRLPEALYVADIVADVGRVIDRQSVRQWLRSQTGVALPSDYEVRGKRLLTFRDLEDGNTPFDAIIDKGTVTSLTPHEYYAYDADQQRTFKSLLRLVLQEQLFSKHVRWSHERRVFFFCPWQSCDNRRVEMWRGYRRSKRTVFERKMMRDDPDKVLSQKHLAFSASFVVISGDWYAVVRPDWYFSTSDLFGQSQFADKQLSMLKRMEKEQSVRNAFRFITSWLATCWTRDLFSGGMSMPRIKFRDPISLRGGRPLDDDLWTPLRDWEQERNDLDDLFSRGGT